MRAPSDIGHEAGEHHVQQASPSRQLDLPPCKVCNQTFSPGKALVNGARRRGTRRATAKAFGAEVTAVCSPRNLEQARSPARPRHRLYERGLTQDDQRYDMIRQCRNHNSRRRRVLTPNGICVLAGMGSAGKHEGQWSRLAGNLKSFFVSPFISQKFKLFIAKLLQDDLTVLRDLMQEGKVKPVIDREYPMSETADALAYLEEGHARGKIVITIP